MDIYCIGRNYAQHARELGNEIPATPVVFLKSYSTLRGLQAEAYAFDSEAFDFEAEIVLKLAQNLPMGTKIDESELKSVLSGAALGLDLTRRETQNQLKAKGLPWTTAKSFKGSSVVSEFTPLDQLGRMEYEFLLNGTLRQIGKPEHMLFSFAQVLTYLLTFNELNQGDLIYTGTPEGVGKIKKGDQFTLKWSHGSSYTGTL